MIIGISKDNLNTELFEEFVKSNKLSFKDVCNKKEFISEGIKVDINVIDTSYSCPNFLSKVYLNRDEGSLFKYYFKTDKLFNQ